MTFIITNLGKAIEVRECGGLPISNYSNQKIKMYPIYEHYTAGKYFYYLMLDGIVGPGCADKITAVERGMVFAGWTKLKIEPIIQKIQSGAIDLSKTR